MEVIYYCKVTAAARVEAHVPHLYVPQEKIVICPVDWNVGRLSRNLDYFVSRDPATIREAAAVAAGEPLRTEGELYYDVTRHDVDERELRLLIEHAKVRDDLTQRINEGVEKLIDAAAAHQKSPQAPKG